MLPDSLKIFKKILFIPSKIIEAIYVFNISASWLRTIIIQPKLRGCAFQKKFNFLDLFGEDCPHFRFGLKMTGSRNEIFFGQIHT